MSKNPLISFPLDYILLSKTGFMNAFNQMPSFTTYFPVSVLKVLFYQSMNSIDTP